MSVSSTSSKKKWLSILIVVVIILAGAFGVLKWYEGKLAGQIKEAVLKEYPEFQGDLSVSLLTSRISARDVSYVDKTLGVDLNIEAEEVSCKGLSTAELLAGDIKHVDELSFTKYKGTMLADTFKDSWHLKDLKNVVVEADSLVLRDVSGEFVALYQKFRQNAPDEVLAPLLKSVHVGRYTWENLRMSIDANEKMSVVLGSFLGNDINIEKAGSAHIKDIEVVFNGKKVASIGLYGFDSIEMPGLSLHYLRLIRSLVEGRMDAMLGTMFELQALPMEAKGFVVKDLLIDGGLVGKIKMNEINADWKKENANSQEVRLGMRELELPTMMLAFSPEGQSFLKHFNKPVVVSLDLDMLVSTSPDGMSSLVNVNSSTLKVNDLLEFASSGKWVFPPFGTPQVAEMDAVLTDQGVTETALLVMADQNGQTAGEMRKNLLVMLSMVGAEVRDPASRELVKSLSAFIENPGIFRLSFKASPPLRVDELGLTMTEEGSSINLKSSASAR